MVIVELDAARDQAPDQHPNASHQEWAAEKDREQPLTMNIQGD
jgi:hypothetical protein